MSDRHRNWDSINHQANTCHDEVYHLLIDLCLDDGDEDLAAAYRWMLKEKKWPVCGSTGWYFSYTQRSNKAQHTWTMPVKPPPDNTQPRGTAAEMIHLGAKLLKDGGYGKWQ